MKTLIAVLILSTLSFAQPKTKVQIQAEQIAALMAANRQLAAQFNEANDKFNEASRLYAELLAERNQIAEQYNIELQRFNELRDATLRSYRAPSAPATVNVQVAAPASKPAFQWYKQPEPDRVTCSSNTMGTQTTTNCYSY